MALAVLVFVFLQEPTGVEILILAALLLLAFGVIEFLARPAEEPPAPAPLDEVPGGAPAGDTGARLVAPSPREAPVHETEQEPAPPRT